MQMLTNDSRRLGVSNGSFEDVFSIVLLHFCTPVRQTPAAPMVSLEKVCASERKGERDEEREFSVSCLLHAPPREARAPYIFFFPPQLPASVYFF